MNTLAYLDRWTARPGEVLSLMASCRSPVASIDVVRIDGPDDCTPIAAYVERLGPIGSQEAVTGSHIVVDDATALALDAFTFTAWILPTMPRSAHRQMIAAHRSPAAGWAIFLDHDGRLVVEANAAEGVVTLRSEAPLTLAWQLVGFALDSGAQSLSIFHGPSAGGMSVRRTAGFSYHPPKAAPLIFGAPHTDVSRAGGDGSYNGKLARPTIHTGAAAPDRKRAIADLPVTAAWDFSAPDADGVRFVNAPRRLLPGPDWQPDADFADQRRLWDAVGLNEDAVDDLGWSPSARIHLPDDLPSGVHAVRLYSADLAEAKTYVPFFVRPLARHRVAVLLPTFTYLAYANHRYASEAAFMGDYAAISDRPVTLGPIDRYLASRPPIGPSIYDQHHDGASVVTSTLLRPVPHMQPQYRWWMTGAPRHFAADLELLSWLKVQAIDYDVLTDHDLDDSPGVLDGYAAVLTGSHPEYVSEPELDELFRYVESGGKLAYLGGNGFYWVTERSTSSPHRIEVRRRRAGKGGWETAPGEHVLTSGREGGLWADVGRPPERLTGVSLAGQGWKKGVAYRRMAGADHPRAAFLFQGVPDTTFGLGGIGGGAVGDEWDALVPGQDNDAQVILLAQSASMDSGYLPGERPEIGPWGDMVLKFHGRQGGSVLSVSSIGFLSALNSDPRLSSILANFVSSALALPPVSTDTGKVDSF